MTQPTSKITLHMVASLDGFIAGKDGDISWMQSTDSYEGGINMSEEYIAEVLEKIDCYVMGAYTYEHALELGWPYGDKPVVVLSGRSIEPARDSVSFYQGDTKALVEEQLRPIYQNTWVVGGAKLIKDFIKSGLADEIVISIMPILLGDGILFFDYLGVQQPLHLLDVTAFSDGMVELSYEILK